MAAKIRLTLACGDYESIRALKEGTVKADGIELTVLTDMTSDIRHWRMIRNREFDVADKVVTEAAQHDVVEARQGFDEKIRAMPDHAEAVGLVALVEAGGDINEAASNLLADPVAVVLRIRKLTEARRLVRRVAARVAA